MNRLGQFALTSTGNESCSLGSEQAQTDEEIHLLLISPIDHSYALSDAFTEKEHSRLAVARNCRELWMIPDLRELWVIPKHETLDVAILHDTISSFELDEACRFIRHQWPSAKILVIRAGENFLDDALYDDRVMPGASAGVLLKAVDEILTRRRQ